LRWHQWLADRFICRPDGGQYHLRRNLSFCLFLSIFAITQALAIRGPFPETYFGPRQSIIDLVVRPVLLYLLTGGVLVYWYIPFIMCIFLLSPLFIRFIHCCAPIRIAITGFFLMVSLFLQRPVNNFLVLQSVVFFTPIYLFGILCSMHKKWIYQHQQNRCLILLAGALLLAAVQALLFASCGDLQKPPFQLQGIDINLLQKLLLCLFFMVFLHRHEAMNSKLFRSLASSSVSIYFLHSWFIYSVSLFQWLYSAICGVHLLPLLSAAVIGASYFLSSQIKAMFPRYSRMLIGW
jgi:probable poly-beta-1,6-N-acetyl-D-glucosamine export protein